MNIIIPLGGKGERFVNNGFVVPKALIPIYGKPMIFHVIDNLVTHPEDNIIIVYNNSLDEHNFASRVQDKYPRIKLVRLSKQTSGAASKRYVKELLDAQIFIKKPCFWIVTLFIQMTLYLHFETPHFLPFFIPLNRQMICLFTLTFPSTHLH